jgi:hypothetical protein
MGQREEASWKKEVLIDVIVERNKKYIHSFASKKKKKKGVVRGKFFCL